MKQEIGNSRAPLLCSCYHDNLRGLSGGFPIDNCPLRIVSNELPPVQLLPGQLLLNDSPWTMHPSGKLSHEKMLPPKFSTGQLPPVPMKLGHFFLNISHRLDYCSSWNFSWDKFSWTFIQENYPWIIFPWRTTLHTIAPHE